MQNEHEEEEVLEETEVEEVVETTPETEEETKSEEVPEAKPTETLEAREARLERQLEQTRKKLGKDVSKPEKKTSKSDEFGYDMKAYLKTSGIESKEFDFVKTEFKQSGLKDIDSLLDNDYFKSRLDNFRKLSKTAEATPTGKRSGGVPTDSVEYWMSKPIEEVPADMRIKVVNKRLEKENGKGVFYNQ